MKVLLLDIPFIFNIIINNVIFDIINDKFSIEEIAYSFFNLSNSNIFQNVWSKNNESYLIETKHKINYNVYNILKIKDIRIKVQILMDLFSNFESQIFKNINLKIISKDVVSADDNFILLLFENIGKYEFGIFYSFLSLIYIIKEKYPNFEFINNISMRIILLFIGDNAYNKRFIINRQLLYCEALLNIPVIKNLENIFKIIIDNENILINISNIINKDNSLLVSSEIKGDKYNEESEKLLIKDNINSISKLLLSNYEESGNDTNIFQHFLNLPIHKQKELIEKLENI